MKTQNKTHNGEILVLCGTGKTGSRVAERLKQRGEAVRIGSRQATPPFDWENSATWEPALQGVQSVYIVFQPDLAVPGAVDTIRGFTKLAVASGVNRLVLLSGRGEEAAQRCEEIVLQSGVQATVLRASWFSQNFSESFLLDAVQAGHVALPTAKAREPFVDVDDIADAAVAALTEPGHNGQIYELTGPRLLDFAEAVGLISDATGRPVRYEAVSIDQYRDALKAYGLPPDFVQLLEYLFTETLDGRNAHLSDGVRRALGREPTDFAEYVRKTAATGVWNRVA